VSDPELDDAPRPPGDPGFSDALTFSFADPEGTVCGVARLGLSDGGASGLVMLFRDGEQLTVLADGEGLFDGSAGELREAVRGEAPEAAGSDFETAFVAFLQHRGH